MDPGDVVVPKAALDALRDDVYVLSCAVADAESDLAARTRPTAAELRRIIDDLFEASAGVRRPGAVPR